MYVIWTERKNVSDVLTKAEELFTGDNVITGHAHYKGVAESSLRIELFNDDKPKFASRVYDFAQWIAEHNEQDSVAVLMQDDPILLRAKNWREAKMSIIRDEFGIEQLDEWRPAVEFGAKGDKPGDQFLDEPEGVYENNGTLKQYPPGDSSDFENPFGAIDMHTMCRTCGLNYGHHYGESCDFENSGRYFKRADELVRCHVNSGHGLAAHPQNYNCIDAKRVK
jgi:hypothetical protein